MTRHVTILNSSGLMLIAALMLACSGFAQGTDFSGDASFVYQVVMCGEGPIPQGIDKEVISSHCAAVDQKMNKYKKDFIDLAMPYIAKELPIKSSGVVVYPFGGCDLVTAMVTYPGAPEYITISLESAGDPRRIARTRGGKLADALAQFRPLLRYHLDTRDSTNDNVRLSDQGLVPGQIAFSIAAARLFGYRPASMRFFRIENSGKITYLDNKDITELENMKGKRLYRSWKDTDFSVAFRNVEILYVPEEKVHKNNSATERTFVHCHIAANLDNTHFAGSGLEKYLRTKGRVRALTKAGSYLLWMENFSALRDWLLSNMNVMVSDSTGILPRHAKAAGFGQTAYGSFNGAFLENNGGTDAEEMKALFKSGPFRELPFRYGYSDIRGAKHMIITAPTNK